jgi:hypothetical protein
VDRSPPKITVWIAVGVATLLALCAAGLALMWWTSGLLGARPEWTVVHAAPPQFHIRAEAKDFELRELGFQDPHYELLFEVPDVARFLDDNHLTKGPPTAPIADDAPIAVQRAYDLEGLVDDQLFHTGQLWESGGKTYAYLVAFGT